MPCDVCSLCRRHVSTVDLDFIDTPSGSIPAHVACIASADDLPANDVDPLLGSPPPWGHDYDPSLDAIVADLCAEAAL
jgi:hypothetical protein